jgi:serine/threonine protein kinase
MADPSKGHFSLVFDAKDDVTGQRIILKFLDPDKMNDPVWLDYFRREGEIGMALRGHPSIVQLLAPPAVHPIRFTLNTSQVVTFPLQFLVTEKAHRDFEAYLYRRRTSPVLWRRLEIVRDVVKGVARLHRSRYCHRDLKPDNIFLYAGGQAKLGDLGLCRSLDDPALLRSNYSGPVGHVRYAAPELFAGAGNQKELYLRADWFAVGSILFESIAGVNLYVTIGLQQVIDLSVIFGQYGSLERFERVVGDIAGSYPIPLLEDYTPVELLARHSQETLTAVDGLIRSLCHFDHRRRLCNFDRILQRLDVALARARLDERLRNQRLSMATGLVKVY